MDCGCPVPGAGIYFCISEVAPDEERTVSIIPVSPPSTCTIVAYLPIFASGTMVCAQVVGQAVMNVTDFAQETR